MPRVLLPLETWRPGPVPGTISYIFRVVVHRLDCTLTPGGGELMLHRWRQPPFHEVDRFLDLLVRRPSHDNEGLAADVRPPDELAVGAAQSWHLGKGNLVGHL